MPMQPPMMPSGLVCAESDITEFLDAAGPPSDAFGQVRTGIQTQFCFILPIRTARELNHDAGNSPVGRGYTGRGAHRHCDSAAQRRQEEGRRRFLVHTAQRRFLILACAAACSSAADAPALVSRIREHMREYIAHLPDYTCRITLERFKRSKVRAPFELSDRLRLEVAYTGGQELYSWPGADRFEAGIEDLLPGHGMVSNGS